MDILKRMILFWSIAFISVCIGFTLKAKDQKIKTGAKCKLQGQYCDVMSPDSQCCAGTSCGIRRSGDHVSNLCVVCRDLGQPCNVSRVCCSGLKCQMITEYASVCNPKSHRPFVPKILSDNSYELNDQSNF